MEQICLENEAGRKLALDAYFKMKDVPIYRINNNNF